MSGQDTSSGASGGSNATPLASTREGNISLQYPILNSNNYHAWAIKMEVYMEAQGVWEAVESELPVETRKDKMALAAIYQGISEETLMQLGAKKSAKEAWTALKTMHLGAARVKEVRAQALRWELESYRMGDNDTIDEFTGKISMTVNRLRSLGEVIDEGYVVKKILRAVSPKFLQIASTMEEFGNIETKTIEEVTGSLKAHEERMRGYESGRNDHVLLAQREARTRNNANLERRPSTRHYGQSRGRGTRRGSAPGREGRKSSDRKPKIDVSKIRCYSCNEYGHFASECEAERTDEDEAHYLEEDLDEPVLLMLEKFEIMVAEKEEKSDEKAMLVTDDHTESLWHYDSGASNHMTGDRNALIEIDETVQGRVRLGDGTTVEIKGQGAALFKCRGGGHLTMSNVYFIPKLRSNIISLGQLDESGARIVVQGGFLRVFDTFDRLIAKVPKAQNRLYTQKMTRASPVCLMAKLKEDPWVWHARLGHINFQTLRKMAREGLVRGLPELVQEDQVCDCCAISKQHRTPFPRTREFLTCDPLELVHGDLCGPITPPTIGGNNYFLLMVDDHSRYMWVEMLSSKDQALEAFKTIKTATELESGRKMKVFRSDRGGEFTSNAFSEFCKKTGLKRQLTAPYSPQQNGVVERRNRTVVEMTRCLLKGKQVPNNLWGEAVKTAVYILNRTPTKGVNGVTPYEAWYGEIPKVEHLRVFGCIAHVKNTRPHLKKLEDRGTKLVFLGYEPGSKAYRFFNPSTKRTVVSRDALFMEEQTWEWNKNSEKQVENRGGNFMVGFRDIVTGNVEEIDNNIGGENGYSASPISGAVGQDITPSPAQTNANPTSTEEPPTQTPTQENPENHEDEESSSREHIRCRSLQDIYNDTVEEELEMSTCLMAIEEPNSFKEAQNSGCWRKAMEEEMDAIIRNNTWELSDLPKGSKAIGLKWIFKLKKNPEGKIVRHKARVVAKGYAQRHGVDFDEVFAPVARLETVRTLLALAAQEGWRVHHLDVKSAFLNGELNEDVYVAQPDGFTVKGKEEKVLKLKKALYGLRQAPRTWNAKLDGSLLDLGFEKSPLEHAVYRRQRNGEILIIGVYVDDLIVMGSSDSEMDEFKQAMKMTYEMSDLGSLSYYLGIEVKQDHDGISLCQSEYALKVLEKMGMGECKPCSVPMDSRTKLSREDESPRVDKTMYRSVIGSLRYLLHTRPDISYAVGVVSRYMEAPTTTHLGAVKQILRYVRGTTRYGCYYHKKQSEKMELVGFCDSDLAGDVDDRKSTSGVIYFLGSSPISWVSQKQKVVALSSCEAEYIAATAGCCQGIWLKRLIRDLKGGEVGEVTLKVDNRSAINLAKNPVYHDRSKHIDIRYHFVRDCVQQGEMLIEYVRTEEQPADILTKALARGRFEELRALIGVTEVKENQD